MPGLDNRSWKLRQRPQPTPDSPWSAVIAVVVVLCGILCFAWRAPLPVEQPDLVRRAMSALAAGTSLYLLLILLHALSNGRVPRRSLVWACLASLLVNVAIVFWFDRVEIGAWHPPSDDRGYHPQSSTVRDRFRYRLSQRPDRVEFDPVHAETPLALPTGGLTAESGSTPRGMGVERELSDTVAAPELERPVAANVVPASPLPPTVARQGESGKLATAKRQSEAPDVSALASPIALPAESFAPPNSAVGEPAMGAAKAEPARRFAAIAPQSEALGAPESPHSVQLTRRRAELERTAPATGVTADLAPDAVARQTRVPPGWNVPPVDLPVAQQTTQVIPVPERGAPVGTQVAKSAGGAEVPLESVGATGAAQPRSAIPIAVDHPWRAALAEVDLPAAQGALPRAPVSAPPTVVSAPIAVPEVAAELFATSIPRGPSAQNAFIPMSPSEQTWQLAESAGRWWEELPDPAHEDSTASSSVPSLPLRHPGQLDPTLPLTDSPVLPPGRLPRRQPTLVAGIEPRVSVDPEQPAARSGAPPSDPNNSPHPNPPAETRSSLAAANTTSAGPSPAVENRATAGLPDELGDADTALASSSPERFLRKQGTIPPADPESGSGLAAPFRQRSARGQGDLPPADQKTNAAIEAGLNYLARCQQPDGSWLLRQGPAESHDDIEPALESPTAATGLALLAFLGGGYQHQEDKYRGTVSSGLAYLVQHQGVSGDLYVRQSADSDSTAWLYSHAIATMALCEAYGMTGDVQLKAPAQRALDFIVAAQHPTLGGWRYTPGVEADTSVSGWMVVALKSGELAGLQVSEAVYDGVKKWLEQARFRPEQPHLYRYNPYANDTREQRHGRVPSRAMSAVGMVMNLYLGGTPQDPDYVAGMEQLRRFPPRIGTTRAPLRDAYYWYYATLAAYYSGGKYWDQWNRELRSTILEAQISRGIWAGSWDPRRPVPDRWAEHAGRLYVTVMNLLSLEVEYRHLPLYTNVDSAQ